MDFYRANVYRIHKSNHQTPDDRWGLVKDMVLYKAVWQSNQFTKWIGKYWKRRREFDDSSRPSKTFSQCPERAGYANGSDFQNDPRRCARQIENPVRITNTYLYKIITMSLTVRKQVLHEKLIVVQLLNEFPEVHYHVHKSPHRFLSWTT
jgi:hypothetical protein